MNGSGFSSDYCRLTNLLVKMTMRRLRRRLSAAIGQRPTTHTDSAKLALPERFPYNRPQFLALDPDHSVVLGDHSTRVIISARDYDSLPCRAGYAEYAVRLLSCPLFCPVLQAVACVRARECEYSKAACERVYIHA